MPPPDLEGDVPQRPLGAEPVERRTDGELLLRRRDLDVELVDDLGAEGHDLAPGEEPAGAGPLPNAVGHEGVVHPGADVLGRGILRLLPRCLEERRLALADRTTARVLGICEEAVRPESVEGELAVTRVPEIGVSVSGAGRDEDEALFGEAPLVDADLFGLAGEDGLDFDA